MGGGEEHAWVGREVFEYGLTDDVKGAGLGHGAMLVEATDIRSRDPQC